MSQHLQIKPTIQTHPPAPTHRPSGQVIPFRHHGNQILMHWTVPSEAHHLVEAVSHVAFVCGASRPLPQILGVITAKTHQSAHSTR